MQADLAGRSHGLHGSQVGVSTLFAAALYEKVFEEDMASLDLEALIAGQLQAETALSGLGQYWGPLTDAVAEELSFKLRGPDAKREQLATVQKKWDAIRTELSQFLRPWQQIKDVLRRAGAPSRISDLGVSLDQFREAALHAREMRRRFTVLDLADDLGVLQRHLDDILSETGLSAE
jgi:glycerol-1-phosphate dehydrogenase [NAD(P)+]